jgi:L-ascorbate metabolism protein UlaG (beta-lactamase superfamily)
MASPVWFRWLGTAGVEVGIANQVLVIDPYLTRFPAWRMWLGRVGPDGDLIAKTIPQCDFVLVTHAHWDHIMDVPDLARNTGARVLGSENSCRLMATCGVPEDRIQQINVGDRLALGEFQVEVIPAKHVRTPCPLQGPVAPGLVVPLRARDYRMDEMYSYRISVGRYRMVTDPGVDPEDGVAADVLFVHPYRKEGYYDVLLRRVRPRMVIPYHWDNIFRSLAKPLRPLPILRLGRWASPPLARVNSGFKRMVEGKRPGTRVLAPEVFCTYDLAQLLEHALAV